MEDKLKIIDRITRRHPSYGVDKGWSHYTGGMKDSGDWYVRKMLNVPTEELQEFLVELIADSNKPPKVYTEQEQADMKIVHTIEGGGFITEYYKKNMERFYMELDRKLLYGSKEHH